ncbi:GlxA family transcriptional regulator [Cupriavidus sp. 2TAF22]|uniref:GlxA family transcriptional regulator n=1 Tax=unclassified Cupriavidus TaxID=2640874 RepID=UPI003F8EA83B
MHIALLALPGVQMLDLAGPMDVFSEACRQLGDPGAYTLQLLSPDTAPIAASNGVRFLPDASLEQARHDIDTLLVAGGPHIAAYEEDGPLIDWLARQATQVRRLGSFYAGAFLLARARLLAGRRATTHWRTCARLAMAYPDIRIEPDHIYVKDGPVYTSAGVTAGMDLALAMVEEDFGNGLALQVAQELVMYLKRAGAQPQLSLQLAVQSSEQNAMRDIQEWILDDVARDLTVEALAQRAGMSVRNFSRLFKRETLTTPADFVELARVDMARRLLVQSGTPLKRIAYQCGFNGQNGLRRAFVRRLSLSPIAYRQLHRSSAPAALFRSVGPPASAQPW